MVYKPTSFEKHLIRECAKRSAGTGRVRLEPGYRYNKDIEREWSLNIALVSDEPDWEDTDLAEFGDWKDFCKGFEWAEGKRAIIDFYVSSVGPDGELETNVTAYWEHGKLVRIEGTGNGVMWKAE